MGVTAVGGTALVLAAAAACASAVASWEGARRGRPAAVAWGRRGLVAVSALVTVGLAALAWALVGQDYSLVYVADHSSRDTSWPYRLAGLWGGMAGSLLLWTWMLAGWAVVASRWLRRRAPELAGGTQAVLAVEAAVFLGLLVTVSRPFATLAVPAIDGGGLTPILRHPAMLYHPPLLYLGYVGLAVPAAIAVAALAGGGRARAWLGAARRFMVPSLVLLAVGMAAGAHWAYVELGWGGYWAWDPVENGALLPWLAGIAFLHSAVVAKRSPAAAGRGPSTHALAFLAFGLSLLGAFLTRSGVTASVHDFAEARAVGRVLLATLAVTTVALAGLAVVRRRRGAREPIDAVTTAGAVRVNNVLLLAVIVVVGFGVLYPVLAGDDLVVTGRYFAVVTAPLALGVLAAIGVGPRLGWRPRPWPELRARLRPAWWGVAALVAAAAGLHDPGPVSLAMIGLAGSAAALTLAEWRDRRCSQTEKRGAAAGGTPSLARRGRVAPKARQRPSPGGAERGEVGSGAGRSGLGAGGLLAHLGVAVLLAGVAGTATGTHRTASLVPGQSATVRDYTLRLEEVRPVAAPDGGRAAQATLTVERADRRVATLRPVALVAASGDRVSEAALRSTPVEDLQIALRTVSGGGGAVVVEIFVVPLAQWVWWGALLTAAGIGLSRRRPTSSDPFPGRDPTNYPSSLPEERVLT